METDDDNLPVPVFATRKPMNEFYDAYCEYMLLKVKIKHRIYRTAKEMLDDTEECIQKNEKLRTIIPFEARTFMTVESAFIIHETIEAIDDIIDEKTKLRDEIWLSNFLPQDESKLQKKIEDVI